MCLAQERRCLPAQLPLEAVTSTIADDLIKRCLRCITAASTEVVSVEGATQPGMLLRLWGKTGHGDPRLYSAFFRKTGRSE